MKEGKDGNPANGQGNDEPTAARRAPLRAARIGMMRWPIRRRLFGGIEGRQACAAGMALGQR